MTAHDPALEVLAGALDDARSTTVEMVMADKFVTCYADDDLQKALGAMSEHQLHRIPVVDQDNKIAGSLRRRMWRHALASRNRQP